MQRSAGTSRTSHARRASARGYVARASAFVLTSSTLLTCYDRGDRWLGRRAPAEPLENRSLVKYKLIIDDIGGWDLFQALLAALRRVADRHGTDIATVASAAVLARPGVAAVIVGARNRAHLAANLAIADTVLDADDMAAIDSVLADARALDGDVYALERDRNGRHGAIMKYNLNEGAAQRAR